MTPDERSQETRLGLTAREWLGLLILLAAAVGLRVWKLGHTATYDEYFHFLAARSWLDNGTLCIADCTQPYDRGAGFTVVVAWFFGLFGDSIEVARLPSVLAGSLTVFAVWAWGRAYLSRGAGMVAAWCCALSPLLIAWSQTVRFYAPQGLLVWCALAGVYATTERPKTAVRTAGILVLSALCVLASLHLQVSTLIPVAAVGLWGTGWLLTRAQARLSWSWQRWALVGGASVAAAAVVLLLWRPGFLGDLWLRYRYGTNLMHADQRDNFFFYHSWFSANYSYLYFFFPAAVLVAVAQQPKPAGFAVTVFTFAFIAHSFGGFKGDRLILYSLPFFFVVWGIALVEAIPWLLNEVRGAVARFHKVITSSHAAQLVSSGLLGAALLFALLNLQAFQTTIRLVTVDDAGWNSAPWYRGNSDWDAIRGDLAPIADSADVILSSTSVKAIYYFGRSDAEINRTQLYSDDDGTFYPEFNPDWRVGRPVVGAPESIERIVSCYGHGLILIESGHWRDPAAVPPETADYIEATTTRITTPPGARMLVFRWTTTPEERQARCDPETLTLMQQR